MTNTLSLAKGSIDFFGVYTLELHLAVLIAWVMVASIMDIREHRIPNWLVASGLVVALGYHTISPFGNGGQFALAGLAVGMCALMPLYALRTMGAGDVKLMGMVGAYLGAAPTIAAVLATFIAGGILALIASAHKGMLPQLAANLRDILVQRNIRQFGTVVGTGPSPSVGKLPYAVAIATGTAIEVFWLHT